MMIRDLSTGMDDERVEELKRRFDRLAEEGTRREPPEELEEKEEA